MSEQIKKKNLLKTYFLLIGLIVIVIVYRPPISVIHQNISFDEPQLEKNKNGFCLLLKKPLIFRTK